MGQFSGILLIVVINTMLKLNRACSLMIQVNDIIAVMGDYFEDNLMGLVIETKHGSLYVQNVGEIQHNEDFSDFCESSTPESITFIVPHDCTTRFKNSAGFSALDISTWR